MTVVKCIGAGKKLMREVWSGCRQFSAGMSKPSPGGLHNLGVLPYWAEHASTGFLLANFSLGGQKTWLAWDLWGLGLILVHPVHICWCLYRSGLTFPPWGSTRMENTSWPSWKSTIWRMVLTWVPSAALRMASCKRPTPNPPSLDIVDNLFHPSPSQSPCLPGLPSCPIWPQSRYCAHCPLNPPRGGNHVSLFQ